MKNYQNHLPSVLLLAYTVYSAFIPLTIAHSIVFFSISGLAAFNQFLVRQQNSSNEKFAQFKQETETAMAQYKEACNARFSKIEDEAAKMALNSLPKVASSSSPTNRKMVF